MQIKVRVASMEAVVTDEIIEMVECIECETWVAPFEIVAHTEDHNDGDLWDRRIDYESENDR